jgi:hypothetical protein
MQRAVVGRLDDPRCFCPSGRPLRMCVLFPSCAVRASSVRCFLYLVSVAAAGGCLACADVAQFVGDIRVAHRVAVPAERALVPLVKLGGG